MGYLSLYKPGSGAANLGPSEEAIYVALKAIHGNAPAKRTPLVILEERVQSEVAAGNFNRAFRLCNKIKREFGADAWARNSKIVLTAHSYA